MERLVFIPIPEKGNAKECKNYHTIELISHTSKVMLKILQARLQQYMNQKLADVQARFRKSRGTRDQIVNLCCTIDKAKEFQKNIFFCFIDYVKAFDCADYSKLWKSLGIPDHLTCLLRNLYACHVQEATVNTVYMEQRTGSKLGEEYIKAIYCHPAYLIYLHSSSCKMSGWLIHKLELRWPGEISTTLDIQTILHKWRKAKRN